MAAASFLSIEAVSKNFTGARGEEIAVIDGVSLAIEEGELVVFLGPSGCGKTTLMRMVGGLDRPSRGRIVLEGEPVSGPDRRKGMVFQSYSSFPWLTVMENVAFGMRYRADLGAAEKAARARHYVELVGLADFADYYLNRVSGGMRQRVALARTLAAGPDILLMDEPFGALDALTREFLQYQLLEICRAERKTVVFVTHDVEEAVFLADRIMIFSARPAVIIEEVKVANLITGERSLETKESEAFFHLRNHVLEVIRVQARRTEELLLRANGRP